MKRKEIILMVPLLLFVLMVQAQKGSAVEKRLDQLYDMAVYHSHWGDKYCYGIKKNGFEGCCDKQGNVIVPPTKYTNVSYDKDDNVFRVKIGDKAGLLDEHGKVLLEADKYTNARWDKDDKMFRVMIGDKAGLLDEHGKVLVEADKYTNVRWDKDNKMYRVKIGDKEGMLDEHGKVLVEADKYTSVYWSKDNKRFRVQIGDKEGMLDEHGKVLVEADKYTSVYWSEDSKVFRVMIGDKAGLLDEHGIVLLEPNKYTDAYWRESDRTIQVKEGDKVGLLDENGKVLIEPIKGSFISRYDKNYKCFIVGELDSQYKTIAKILYSPQRKPIFESKTMEDMGDFGEGLIAIQENGLWGYMDVTNGNMVISAQYTSVEKFEGGIAKVSKDNESFIISNPLSGKGSEVISSLTMGQSVHSDIDEDIFKSTIADENTFAVVISVQNYSDFVVPYATSDGKTFRQYCEKSLGIPHSNVMYYEDATLNNIHSAMTRVYDIADAFDGDAKIIFYFAGQGVTDDAGNPYLMPSDVSLKMLSATGYAVEKLYNELGDLNVQSALVLLDAGFTNENRDGKKVPNEKTSVRTKNVPISGKVIAFTAASQGEFACVYKEKGHGMFTYFLCKKIKESKGNVNLQELFEYMKTNVLKTSQEKTGKLQTPQCSFANSITLKNIKL